MANVSKAWGYERQVWVMSAGEADVDHDTGSGIIEAPSGVKL